jgi:chemotaxis signal transduction protein
VVGVVGWRGRLLTIMDLRAILGGATGALDDLAFVVVLGEERSAFGILVDAVEEIATIPATAWSAAERGIRVSERYVRGVLPDAALMLDAAELLRIDDDANLEDGTS